LEQKKFPITKYCEHGKIPPVAVAREEVKVLPRYLMPETLGNFQVGEGMCAECTGSFSRKW
jgi:hypothetical protein